MTLSSNYSIVTQNKYSKCFRRTEFVNKFFATEIQNNQETTQLAFMARALVMATLPHSKPNNNYFERKNGSYTLSMQANPNYGLPYGSIPRLLLAWLTTEAISKKSPEIHLGNTLTSFLKKLNLRHGGGIRGNATRVRDQLIRLLTCRISCLYEDKKKGICEGDQFNISRSFKLWWNPIDTQQKEFLTGSKIILSADFFEELIKSPVPVSFDTLNILRQSPLQIDLYIWLTHRFFSLKQETLIAWKTLKDQFGSDYLSYASDPTRGLRNFKTKFIQALKKVLLVYGQANVCPNEKGLLLYPSDTHVKKTKNAYLACG